MYSWGASCHEGEVSAFALSQSSTRLPRRSLRSKIFQLAFSAYPALTDPIKRKVLGLNALRLHKVDPVNARCTFTRDDLETIRRTIPTANQAFGPRSTSELRAFVAHEREGAGI